VETALGTAEIALTAVRFDACASAWHPGALRLPVCAILESGVLRGQGMDTTGARSQTRSLVELGVGLQPTWTVGHRYFVGLSVGGAAALARYRFYFRPPDATAYRLPPWSTFGAIDLGVLIW
jgi:hypothetical protein